MAHDDDEATITLLYVPLVLIHIPRNRLHDYAKPIIAQLTRKHSLGNAHFLSITCNEIEVSILAPEGTVAEFEQLILEDEEELEAEHRRNNEGYTIRRSSFQPAEKCKDAWCVLQFDNHTEDPTGGTATARIRQLSVPLAAAGIPILYQSALVSDYIFVQHKRLSEALSILSSKWFECWNVYNLSAKSPCDSFAKDLRGPFAPESKERWDEILMKAGQSRHFVEISSRDYFPKQRRKNPSSYSEERGGQLNSFGNIGRMPSILAPLSPVLSTKRPTPPPRSLGITTYSSSTRNTAGAAKSLKPSSSSPVRLLHSVIDSVSLKPEEIETKGDSWINRVIKVIFFPETVDVPPYSAFKPQNQKSRSESFPTKSTKPPSGISLLRPFNLVKVQTPSSELGSGIRVDDTLVEVAAMVKDSKSTPKCSAWQRGKPCQCGLHCYSNNYDDCSLHSWPDDHDEQFFSTGGYQRGEETHGKYTGNRVRFATPISHSGSTPSLVSTSSSGDGDTVTDLKFTRTPTTTQPRSNQGRLPPGSSVPPSKTPFRASSENNVPFISITYNREGYSISTDTRMIYSLFVRQRYPVFTRKNARKKQIVWEWAGKPATDDERYRDVVYVDESHEEFDIDALQNIEEQVLWELKVPPMCCLQLDLGKHGIDQHGLVARFSRQLDKENVNHMYYSTYQTANILVEKNRVKQAQDLLRSLFSN